jgi:O-antigen ligase
LVLIFGVAFIVDLTIVLVVSGTNFYQEFFGTFGRATGYVAYVALASLLMVAAVTASTFALKRFTWSLLAAGLISIVYGIVQALKLDPIKWVNQYSPVIGFLGNPNFQSSFVGFSGVMAFAMLLGKEVKATWRAGYVAYVVAAAYVIKETHSQQGFLVLMGGIAVVAFIWISRSKIKVLTIPSLVVGLAGVVLVTLGSLNTGPLASVLYKESVTYRGDYWRAGWKMSVEHPFFGVGLDSFGDWYRRARDTQALVLPGPNTVTNAAHNVPFDVFAFGGWPLFISYLGILALSVIAIIKVTARTRAYDPIFVTLTTGWVCYQLQSIISINQIGLAIWGWLFGGALIAYEVATRPKEINDGEPTGKTNGPRVVKKKQSETIFSSTLIAGIGAVIGLLIASPPYSADAKWRSAISSQDAQKVEQALIPTYLNPANSYKYANAAQIFEESKLFDLAYKYAKVGVEFNPDNFDAWRVLYSVSKSTQEEKAEALAQMKRLDPNNPNVLG